MMPRRPADIQDKVPLFLIPSVVKKEVAKAGEELHHIVVKKAGRHFYNIAIHTRSLKRELKAGVQRAGTPEMSGGAA